MHKQQEPKYRIENGSLVNRSSNEAIPDDEPVFIFRARDALAVQALQNYAASIRAAGREPQGFHADAVDGRVADFQRFAVEHPDRMKWPDTAKVE